MGPSVSRMTLEDRSSRSIFGYPQGETITCWARFAVDSNLGIHAHHRWSLSTIRGHTSLRAGAMGAHTLGHEAKRIPQQMASEDRGSPRAEAIPNTGLAAAEATLEAAASAPSFAGLDVGKELARLAQRATEMRR